jgi:type I restriction enzyme, S subunit
VLVKTDYLKIRDFCEVFDGPHATPTKTKEGPYYLSISSLENGKIDLTKSAHISEKEFVRWTKRVTPQKGDLLFSYETRLGEAALMPDGIKACLGRRMGILRPDPQKVLPEYLLYSYLSPEFQGVIISNTITGATVDRLSLTDMPNFEMRIPAISEQKEIAAILSALDAKIELNNLINAELEGMAKLLYDYWFVQHDFPISAAQAAALGKPHLTGKPYRSSGLPMTYNPQLKREIPKGWEVGSLLDIATFTNGIACQKYPQLSEAFLRVIKIKEMRDGFSDNSERVTPDVPEKVIVHDGDILFSWSASLEVMIWSGGTGALNQHIFKVTSENYPRSICYFALQGCLQHFKMMADLRKTTMGHITREHLEQSRIAIPPKETADNFESIAQPIFNQIINNHQQNQELAQLRDWLLPMLMNGQVSVSNS